MLLIVNLHFNVGVRDVKGITRGHVIPHQNIQPVLARLNALYSCLQHMENKLHADLSSYQVLDVGCASGYGLTPFLVGGFYMDQLNGIDIFEERVSLGNTKYPGLKLNVGDATRMDICE